MVAVAIVAATALILLLAWYAREILLSIFAGILLSVLLHGASQVLSDHTPLSRKSALGLILLALLLTAILAGALLFPELADQATQLGQELRDSWASIQERFSASSAGKWLLQQAPSPGELRGDVSSIFAGVSAAFSTTLNIATEFIIILFFAVYLAYEPQVYTNGLLKLAPKERRPRLRAVLDEMAYSLRWWLVGQFISMSIIGVLATAGFMLLGLPLAMLLGFLAGLFQFIPVLGPALAFIPPILIALSIDPQTALYVLLLYLGIQTAESYFVTPAIQKGIVSLPPVVLIASQLLLGLFAGLVGFMLAVPLAVVGMVALKMLYVEDILGDHAVDLLSERRVDEAETEPVQEKREQKPYELSQ